MTGVDEQAIITALRTVAVPDEAAARERARRVMLAAVPLPSRRASRWRVTAVLAIALIVAAVGTATAAQGPAAVAHWVRVTLGVTHHARLPGGLSALPGGGRLLVVTGGDAWIVGQGSPRRVPHAGGALAWSAFGHYLVQAQGTALTALDLRGRVRWSERYGSPVTDPVWSPDGNRIAFFVGARLWVTAGDGTAPAPLGAATTVVAPAWRPGGGHVLAVLTASQRVASIDVDTRTVLGRVTIGPGPVALGWSGDGTRLLAAARGSARVYDQQGRLIRLWRAPAGDRIISAQIAPAGGSFALLVRASPLQSQAVLVPTAARVAPRVLLSGGALADLTFSPDGHWILVGWRELGSWLFFSTDPANPRVVERVGIARQLGNGEPVVNGWCCQRPSPRPDSTVSPP